MIRLWYDKRKVDMPHGLKRIKLNRIAFLVLVLSHSRASHISTLSLYLFLFFHLNL